MDQRGRPRMAAQKRLACDRCHARKMRCVRDRSTEMCSRCMQDGTDCHYSAPLKPGRPKKASVATENNRPERSAEASLPSSPLFDNNNSAYGGMNFEQSPAFFPYLSQLGMGLDTMNNRMGFYLPCAEQAYSLFGFSEVSILIMCCYSQRPLHLDRSFKEPRAGFVNGSHRHRLARPVDGRRTIPPRRWSGKALE